MYFILFIHLPVERHLAGLEFLAVLNSAAMSRVEQGLCGRMEWLLGLQPRVVHLDVEVGQFPSS